MFYGVLWCLADFWFKLFYYFTDNYLDLSLCLLTSHLLFSHYDNHVAHIREPSLGATWVLQSLRSWPRKPGTAKKLPPQVAYRRKCCWTIKTVETTSCPARAGQGCWPFTQESDSSSILIGMCTTCAKIMIIIIELQGKWKPCSVNLAWSHVFTIIPVNCRQKKKKTSYRNQVRPGQRGNDATTVLVKAGSFFIYIVIYRL